MERSGGCQEKRNGLKSMVEQLLKNSYLSPKSSFRAWPGIQDFFPDPAFVSFLSPILGGEGRVRGPGSSLVGIENIEKQRKCAKDPHAERNFLWPACQSFQHRVRKQPSRHPHADVVSEDHQRDGKKGRDELGIILEINSGDRADHENADDDEGCSVSVGRNRGKER